MKKKLFYHIYLNDYGTWSHIFMEQFKLMEDNGLLSEFDDVTVTALVKDSKDFDRLVNFNSLIHTFGLKNLRVHSFIDEPEAENVMMQEIWKQSNEEKETFQFLYLHSKGITSVANHLMVGDVQKFKNYYYWRHFLNWGVIENWRKCVDALNTGAYNNSAYDLAGVNYFDSPAPHYSGAFYWGKSDYVRKLPDPSTKDWWRTLQRETQDSWLKTAEDRFRDEMWICSEKSCRAFSVQNLYQVTNLSATFLPRAAYA